MILSSRTTLIGRQAPLASKMAFPIAARAACRHMTANRGVIPAIPGVRQEALLGTLEVGKKADRIVLDTQRTHLVPAGRILSAWIHNGQPSDIESVLVNGRFVMRDRKILTVDEPGLIAEADDVGRRIWSQVEAATPLTVPRLPRS